MTDYTIDYIIKAIDFVANYGHLFLNQYKYDKNANIWTHLTFKNDDIIYDYNYINPSKNVIFTKENALQYLIYAYNLIKKIN